MRKFTIVFFISLVGLMFINSCKKDDGYDFNKVEPGKQTIAGSTFIKGNNITKYEYLAIPRGGSTYEWKVQSGPISIITDPEHPYRIELVADTRYSTVGRLWVQETTHGGIKGAPDSIRISVRSYCTFVQDSFIGKFTCTETGFIKYDANFIKLNTDTILNDNFFASGWKVPFAFSGDLDENITIVKTKQVYNNQEVNVTGKGNYNTCTGQITLKYAIVTLYGDSIEQGSNVWAPK